MAHGFDNSFEELIVDTDLSSYLERYRREVADTILEYGLHRDSMYCLEYTWGDSHPEEMFLDSATLVEVIDGEPVRRIDLTLTDDGKLPGCLDDILHECRTTTTVHDLLYEDAIESRYYR